MINKIGKRGVANKEARDRIAEIAEAEGIESCEIQLPGCESTFGIAPAHRHPRDWYNGDPDKLCDPKQWVGACQYCHNEIDTDEALKIQIFDQIRGAE